MPKASLAALVAFSFIINSTLSNAAPRIMHPSFNIIETKLYSYESFSNKYASSLSGSYNFSGQYFVNSSIGFGSSNVAGNERSIGLGIFKPIGQTSAIFATVGAQRYSYDVSAGGVALTQNSAALSAGMRSIFWNRAELEMGITALASGPISARFGLKGTYHFTEKVGAVVELGSSDGDTSSGIGFRYRF